jgi:hypothetical protein
MKKSQSAGMPLPDDAGAIDNKPQQQRQRLADLLGLLLARYWLKKCDELPGIKLEAESDASDSDQG